MKDLKAYKHVIWDWNGTLFNDAWLCTDVMNQILRKRGLPLLTVESYQEHFDFPVIEYYRRIGFDFSRETFEEAGTEFIDAYEKRRLEADLHPAARDVLRAFQKAGASQSVLSAYKQTTLNELIGHFGLNAFFQKLVGLQDHYASGKIDNGKRWIAETGFAPTDVLMIGDTTHDFEVARAIGADCVLVFGGHNSIGRLRACGVPVFESLGEIIGQTGPIRPIS